MEYRVTELKKLKERVSEVSYYLQRLVSPSFFLDVEKAVADENEDMLIAVCKKAEVPAEYISSVVPLLVTVSRQPKWPTTL